MYQFEVGQTYYRNDRGFDPVTVTKRTAKTIWVQDTSGHQWSMRVRHNEHGSEYACDYQIPERNRTLMGFSAANKEELA